MRDNKLIKKHKNCRKEGKSSKKSRVSKGFLLVLVGGIIGLINGFFGGGGGMVCVPALEHFLKMPEKNAHASAILVIFPLTFVSSIIYILNGNIQSLALLTVGGGVLIGGVLGSFLLKWLPEKFVGVIFAILMLVAGVRLLI